MMNLNELKIVIEYLPCPFCGGEAQEVFDLSKLSVKCSICGIETRGAYGTLPTVLKSYYNIPIEQAIELSNLIRKNRAAELWNTRVKL